MNYSTVSSALSSTMKINQELTYNFLRNICSRHISEYGDSIGSLKFSRFRVDDKTLLDGIVVGKTDDKSSEYSITIMRLADELQALGFVEKRNMVFTITPNGYMASKRASRPYMSFFALHWKWLFGAFFSIITILLAVIRLTECK